MKYTKEEFEFIFDKYDRNPMKTAAGLSESPATIISHLSVYDIPYNLCGGNLYKEIQKIDFSDFQKAIILGSVLGDGHLENRKHLKNASFREEHSLDQYDWLNWKRKNLKPFVKAKLWVRDRGDVALMPDGHGGKKEYNIQKVVALSTNTHPYLTYMHSLFYKNRKKIINKNYMESNFDINAFAVLLGDDGYFGNGEITICCESFSLDDIEYLSSCISNIFQGTVNIRRKYGSDENKYRIYLSSFENNKFFFNKLRKILPLCMHYKIP